MEEQFETFDDENNPLGLALRSCVHRQGLWHQSANIFLFRRSGAIVLNRRALDKDVAPGKWDICVGEHLKPGETFADAARRGMQEEFGVVVDLEFLGEVTRYTYSSPDGKVNDREMQQCFYAVDDIKIAADAGEIMEVSVMSVAELIRSMSVYPARYTPWAPNLLAKLDGLRLSQQAVDRVETAGAHQ